MGNRVVKSTTVKQGLYDISETANGDVGSVMEFEDGRKYIYCKNGDETLTPGAVIQGPVLNSNDEDITVSASASIKDKTISITTARIYLANELQDGWIYVASGGGELGHGRKIKSHPYAGNSSTLVITLYDALTDVITAGANKVTVVENPYIGVMLHNGAPGSMDGPTIGVAPLDVTAEYYFWLQTKGACPVVATASAITIGDVTASAAKCVVADGSNDATIGRAMTAADANDAVLVDLNLT